LSVHVQPNARHTAVAGIHGGALKIRVAAPAVDDKANAALVSFLGERLGIARSHLTVRRGARGRRKEIEITAEADSLPDWERLARGAPEL
jgi:uncharacterized protein (TIGR00251 family)